MSDDDLPPWVTEGPPDEEQTPQPEGPFKSDASLVTDYRYADGSLAFKVCRWEIKNGHKDKKILPYTWDGRSWVCQNLVPSGERPLLNLPQIVNSPNASILWVEGEKKALKAASYLPPDWIVTTWANGANGMGATNITPLIGRRVVAWPDNNAAGRDAVKSLTAAIPTVKAIDIPFDVPDGWDLGDPLPEGKDAAWVWQLITGAKAGKSETPPPKPETNSRPIINPVDWYGVPVPARQWIVEDLLPANVVTMLSGDGGLGKSTLALQLAIACAMEDSWLGFKTTPCKVLIVACEDEPEELHRRIYSIIQASPFDFSNLVDLRIIPGAGHDNILVDFDDHANHGKRTEFCDFVAAEAKKFGARLTILDSLHDFFGGNENARPQARQFINHLRKIAMDTTGAVLLLAHPSVSGLTNKDGRSGSTAWGNTVRSRLYLTKPDDPDASHLLLKTVKANYAKSGGETRIEYRSGQFYPLDIQANPDPVYQQVQVDDIFLTCLKSCTANGRRVTNSKHGHYAPKEFAAMKSINRGYTILDFERAMVRLFEDKKIVLGEVKTGHRKSAEGIIATPNSAVHNEEF